MNVIEAFFITLGLDTRDYEKKQKEVDVSLKKLGTASDKQTKLIAEGGKKAADSFSKLKIEVLGALAAFGMGAGFKAFIQDSMNMQAAAGRQAAALGVSANSLQVWKQMAVEMGESGDAAVGTLSAIAQGMANARQGHMDWFNTAMRLGVKGLSLNDSTDTALAKINEAAYLIKEKYGAPQAVNFLEQLGIGDLAQQTQLMENPAKLASDRANAAKHSIQLTQKEIEQNQKLQKQLGDLWGDFEKLKVQLENKLAPVVIKLGKEFENWINSIDWDKVIAKVGEFFDTLQKIVQALGGVKGILIEIAAIKVFGWIANVGMWVLKLRSLTAALSAARAAAAAGGAAGAAGGAAAATDVAAAAGGASLLSKFGFLGRLLGKFGPGLALGFGLQQDEMLDWKKRLGLRDANPSAAAAAKQALTRGIRNNNPGNIKYGAFAKSMGATAADSAGFAIFPTANAGIAAIQKNLEAYGRKGFDTPFEIAHRWSTTDQAAYTKRLADLFGGNPNKQLDMSDPKVIAALSRGIITQENGFNPYASLASTGAYVGAPRVQSGASSKPSTTTNTVTINGPINVQTKATDANGVAKGIRKAFRDNPLIAGSVTALS